jgi:hypothetical protein
VVLVVHVGGSHALDIKLILHRKPRIGNAWFYYGFVETNEEYAVDVIVHEFFEETGIIHAVDDLTILSGVGVRVALPEGEYQLVYVYAASVHVPYVIANLRSPPKVEQVVTSRSTVIHHAGSCVVPATIALTV